MSEPEILWDAAKGRANKEKHGVSFEEASEAFRDPDGLLLFDPDHSAAEDRFVLLGLSLRLRLLVVCHCYRQDDSIIRIISARKAGLREETQYWSKRT